MWAVARRPRWIAMLLLALAVAAGFAALGQWQLERSIASGTVVDRDTETVKPLVDVADPQSSMDERLNGQRVELTGAFVPGDYRVVSSRVNGGVEGFWVIGHLQTDAAGESGAAVVVAVGWSASRDGALAAVDALDREAGEDATTVVGRYVSPEPPQLSDFENDELSQVSPAALVNDWAGFDGPVFAGYVVAADAAPGLDVIDAPEATDDVSLNWLNVFYAVEWAVFAVFAVFLWYRLVRDTWEREEEERAEAEELRSHAVTGATADGTSVGGRS